MLKDAAVIFLHLGAIVATAQQPTVDWYRTYVLQHAFYALQDAYAHAPWSGWPALALT